MSIDQDAKQYGIFPPSFIHLFITAIEKKNVTTTHVEGPESIVTLESCFTGSVIPEKGYTGSPIYKNCRNFS